jgi:hypothetical protein
MNGQLIRDCNKVKRITKKENNRKKSNSNNKTRIKNSTIDNTSLNEKASSANPFVWKKDINVWLTEEGQLYLQSWANDGLSNLEIAKKMGVCEDTFYRWCNQEPRIKSAITRGRDTMTMEVENILYKCARGYMYEEDALTKDGEVVRVQKYQPPSTEAQKFILTNRRKDKWKSKNEVALEAQIAAQANEEISKSDSLADDLFGDDEQDETI